MGEEIKTIRFLRVKERLYIRVEDAAELIEMLAASEETDACNRFYILAQRLRDKIKEPQDVQL